MTIKAQGIYAYQFNVGHADSAVRATLRVEPESEFTEIVHLLVEADESTVPPVCRLEWSLPIIDIQGTWHPSVNTRRRLTPDWSAAFESKSTSSAPVVCLFNAKSTNRLTFACSDVLNVVRFQAGVHEEDSALRCYFAFFDTPTTPLKRYEAQVRIDKREIPYYDVLRDVSEGWQSYAINTPADVPPAALEPMYSTWYSFHQQVDPAGIEEQCRPDSMTKRPAMIRHRSQQAVFHF